MTADRWMYDALLLAAQVGVTVGLAAIVVRFTKATQWRRALWQACVLAVFVIALLELTGTGRFLVEMTRTRSAGVSPASSVAVSAPPYHGEGETPSQVAAETAALHNRAAPLGFSERTPLRSASPPENSFTWALCLWFGGTAILVGRLALKRIVFLFFCRSGTLVQDARLLEELRRLATQLRVRGRVRLIEIAPLKAPIAFGFFRRTIGLPPGFAHAPVAQRSVMLAHELAHLAARDGRWYLVADLAAALLWWHPMVWWARRCLHESSETAADESSLLIDNGPNVLAECLLEIGNRLHRSPVSLNIGGFRSGLGRRVEALLKLHGRSDTPKNKFTFVLAKVSVPAALVAGAILCTAWTSPQPLTKGQNMKTHLWKRSLPAFALMAFISNPPDSLAADKSKKPETSSAIGKKDQGSAGASPYRESSRPGKWKGAERVRQKLSEIMLDQVAYDSLPLGEVVRQLIEESRHRDPDKNGINFLMVNGPPPPGPIDPQTGLPMTPAEPVDVSAIVVRIVPPLTNVRLIDALDAIVKVADRPIQYSIQDYGVVFSLYPDGSTESLATETFQAQADIFFKGIQSAFGIEVPGPLVVNAESTPSSTVLKLWALKHQQAEDELRRVKELAEQKLVSAAELDRAKAAAETARLEMAAKEEELRSTKQIGVPPREVQQQIFRELLAQLGIRLDPPKSIFFNELTGIVMVRVGAHEMDAVRAVIETLGGTPTSKLAGTAGGSSKQ